MTYDIDGNKEAVFDGETGFVIPPFDKENARGETRGADARSGDAKVDGIEGEGIRPVAV